MNSETSLMMLSETHDNHPSLTGSTDTLDPTRKPLFIQVFDDVNAGYPMADVMERLIDTINQQVYPKCIVYSKAVAGKSLEPIYPKILTQRMHHQGTLDCLLLNQDLCSSQSDRYCCLDTYLNPLAAEEHVPVSQVPRVTTQTVKYRCILEIPLKAKNKLLGVLHLLAPESLQWLTSEVEMLHDLSQLLSVILSNEHFEQECIWAETALRQLELSQRSLFRSIPVMMHVTDCTDRIIEVSDIWVQQMGYSRDEVIGARLIDFMTEESRCYAETTILFTYFKTGSCNNIPYKLVTKKRDVLDILFSGTIERDERGTVVRRIETLANVTRQREVERQLFREKELAQVTLQSIGDAVITTDVNGNVDYLNPIAETLTGWRIQEAKGASINEVMPIIHEMTRLPITNPVEQVLKHRRRFELANHAVLINRFGEERAIQDSAAPILGSDGTLLGAVLAFHDVTDTRLMERQMVWQATHDSLTGLVNRREFEKRLTEAIHTTHRDGHQHVLCYLDLDRFKIINDSYGHAAGDELLRQVALLIRNQISAPHVVARLGGDEFGIIMYHTDLAHAQNISDAIRQSIQDFRFAWKKYQSTICVSIGLVQIDAQSSDLVQVMSAADAVCYAAKKRGRNRVYPYHHDDIEVAQQREERYWIERLNRALETDRFQLYAQTIQLTAAPKHHGIYLHEVLLRLVDEKGALVLPLNFMPAAEQYSLMPSIDQWVIRSFLKTYVARGGVCLRTPVMKDCLFTINLSGATVNDDQFLDFLQAQFDEFQVPPQSICFEITERVAIANLDKAAQMVQAIKQIGCRFALDDFGSGVSSFSYLRHLPIDYLKIDGNFVRNLLSDPVNCAIVEAVNHIGHLMGIQTIAEFVETSDIRERLKIMGIDYVQGFAVHRPVPLLELK